MEGEITSTTAHSTVLAMGQALGAVHSCIISFNPQDNSEVGAMSQSRTQRTSGGEVAGSGFIARKWET